MKLGADIVLNEGNAKEWAEKAPENWWKPIQKFAGTFDGQNHTISGLYGIAHDSRLALFTDAVYTCKIQNLKLTNSYFKTSGNQGTASFVSGGGGKLIGLYSDAIFDHNGENVGGIASKINKQSAFEECWYDGVINITSRDCGGIVDEIAGARAEVKHCLFSGTINQSYDFGGTKTGGLIGWVDASGSIVLQDSLSSGKVNCEKTVYTGGVIGATTTGSQNSVRNSYMSSETYATTIATANGTYDGKPLSIREQELTGVKAYQWTTLDFENYWAAVEGDSPILARFADTSLSLEGVEKAYDTSWYQSGAFNFQIMNAKQLYGLYLVSAYDTFSNKTVKLGADITVNAGTPAEWAKNAPTNPWYPIANFAGIFDGQGHSINGIYSVTNLTYQGLFDKTTDTSVIKNVSIKNSYFENTADGTLAAVGSIAGDFRGTMENVYSNAVIVSHGNQAGGLIARANDSDSNGVDDEIVIKNCWFDGSLSLKGEKTMYGGGIVGVLVQGDLELAHCLNAAPISSEAVDTGVHIGGLIGAVWGKGVTSVSDSLNTGTISAKYTVAVGSVIGRGNKSAQTFNITNTYATKESYGRAIGSATSSKMNGGVIRLAESWLTGYNAYRWTELDFPNYWAIVKNDTPILQHFASSDPSISGIAKAVDTSWYKADAKEMVIDSVEDLYGFAMLGATTNFKDQTVKLGKDIVVNKVDEAILASWVNGTVVPENTWIPIGDSTKSFAGTFDGQGHTISGVYLNTTEAYSGFFGYTVDTAMIKNFRLVDSYFVNTATSMNALGSIAGELRGDMDKVYSNAIVVANGSQAGGMVGRINDNDSNGVKDEVTITNCWYDGEFYMKGEKTQDGGGIAGRLMQGNLVMEHCLNTGLISSEATGTGLHVGGLVGAVRSANSTFTLKDSLNTGKIDVNYPTCVGSILGRANNKTQVVTIENTYATSESYNRAIGSATTAKVDGSVTALEEIWFTGDNAYRYSSLDYAKYWTTVKDDTPILQAFAETIVSAEELAKLVDTSWYDEKADEHHIQTVAQLYGFMKMSVQGETFKNQTIYLDNDLTVNAVEDGTIEKWKSGDETPGLIWIPVGTSSNAFEGTFDGLGNTISGLYVKTGSRYAGLFGYVKDATIENIRLEDSYLESTIAGTASLASIVGGGSGNVANAYSNATLQSTGVEVGGIVANAAGMNIESCWYDGSASIVFSTDTDSARFGGIVGTGSTAANTVNNCLFTGTMDMDYYGTSKTQGTYGSRIGGIVGGDGQVVMTVTNTISAGTISAVWYKEATGNTAASNKFSRLDDVLGYKENADTKYSENVYSATQASWQIEEDGTINDFSGNMGKSDLSDINAYYITMLDFDDEWVVRKDDIAAPKELALASEVASLENVIEPDTEWYNSEAEDLYIDTVEELYGMMRLSLQGKTFVGQTVHLEKSLTINEVTTGTIASWQAGTKPNNIWIPIGTEGVKFEGTFDGHGNKITGLYLKTGTRYAGLFGYVKNATIQNIRLEDSYLESTAYAGATLGSLIGMGSGSLLHSYSNATMVSSGYEVGGLVAKPAGMTINGCWYAGTVTVNRTTSTASAYFGGLIGRGTTAENIINNSLFTGIMNMNYTSVDPTQRYWGSRVGGLAGDDGSQKLTIRNTIGAGTMNLVWNKDAAGSTAPVSFSSTSYSDVVGYKGHDDTTSSENVYSATTGSLYVEAKDTTKAIAGSTDIGELKDSAGFYGTSLDFEDMWVARTNEVPAPRRLTTSGQITGLKKPDTSWFDPDNKQEEYVLSKEEELLGLATIVNAGEPFEDITIKLGKNMVMNEVNDNILASWENGTATPKVVWTPIGKSTSICFNGKFDGNGYTISGLYASSTNSVSLFGATQTKAEIRNVAITNSVFKATGDYLGGVVGYFRGTNIENVYSDATLVFLGSSASEYGIGGIVGRLRIEGHNTAKTIKNCWYGGDIIIQQNTVSRIAGIVGDINGNWNNFRLTMENCLFNGSMTVKAASTVSGLGGILGVNGNSKNHTFILKNCVNGGTIHDLSENTSGVGLFASSMSATAEGNSITNCYVVDDGEHGVLSETHFGMANAWTERDAALTNVKVARSVLLADETADLTALFGDGASDVWMCYTNTRGNAKGAPILKQFANVWLAKQKWVQTPDTSWFDPDDKKTEYTLLDENELLGFAVLVNGGEKFEGITIKLGKDMEMNAVNEQTLASWKTGTEPRNEWTPIGNGTTNYFNGTFDGCGKNIKGLYVDGNGYDGFFGAVREKGVIKNFSITDSFFKTSGNYLGSAVGYCEGNVIENIYSDAILLPNATGSGGIVGRWRMKAHNITKSLQNCWYDGEIIINQGTVTGVGGLIGDLFGAYNSILQVENSLFSGEITIDAASTAKASFIGGILGMNRNNCQHTFKLKNCVSVGEINNSLENTFGIGLLAGTMAAKASNNEITNCYVVDNNSIENIIGYSEANSTLYVGANLWTGRDTALSTVKVARNSLLAKTEAELEELFGSNASDVWMCHVDEQGNALGTPLLKEFVSRWLAKQTTSASNNN